MEEQTIQRLEQKANRLRALVVKMIGPEKTGHLGGACSLAEILSVLYFGFMRHDPENPQWPQRNRLILSKGHAGILQYAALAECGYFPQQWCRGLKQLGSPLQGHPDKNKVPGIEANTGSLGQGDSMAAGVAAGLKLDFPERPPRVYAITGDGELAEGQIWEALLSAAVYRLDNLRVVVDQNGLQATGPTKERFPIPHLEEKFRAFGFAVFTVDGHNVREILEALQKAEEVRGKPVAIVAQTVKGKGISFAENQPSFHNGAMTREQYETALRELEEKAGEAL